MKLTAALVGALMALPSLAQEKKQEPAAPEMAMPKPGPEHEILKQDVGTWDATVESFMVPGQPPAISKGVSVTKMVGAFWLLDEFESEFMNQPFRGTGTLGYDPIKKKYVGTWVDSMAPGLNLSESSYDAKTRTMTGWIDGPGPDGKPMKTREVTEWKDADTKVFSMFAPGADGKEALMMRITYKRRK